MEDFLIWTLALLTVASIIACPISLVVWIWTFNLTALQIALTTGLFAYCSTTLVDNYNNKVENEGEDGRI